MSTEWAVQYQRNDGPVSEDGLRHVSDDWSRVVTAALPTRRDAAALALRMENSPRTFRRIRVVKRDVSRWVIS